MYWAPNLYYVTVDLLWRGLVTPPNLGHKHPVWSPTARTRPHGLHIRICSPKPSNKRASVVLASYINNLFYLCSICFSITTLLRINFAKLSFKNFLKNYLIKSPTRFYDDLGCAMSSEALCEGGRLCDQTVVWVRNDPKESKGTICLSSEALAKEDVRGLEGWQEPSIKDQP